MGPCTVEERVGKERKGRVDEGKGEEEGRESFARLLGQSLITKL